MSAEQKVSDLCLSSRLEAILAPLKGNLGNNSDDDNVNDNDDARVKIQRYCRKPFINIFLFLEISFIYLSSAVLSVWLLHAGFL